MAKASVHRANLQQALLSVQSLVNLKTMRFEKSLCQVDRLQYSNHEECSSMKVIHLEQELNLKQEWHETTQWWVALWTDSQVGFSVTVIQWEHLTQGTSLEIWRANKTYQWSVIRLQLSQSLQRWKQHRIWQGTPRCIEKYRQTDSMNRTDSLWWKLVLIEEMMMTKSLVRIVTIGSVPPRELLTVDPISRICHQNH